MMAIRKLFLALFIILQSACNARAEPATSPPVVEAEATPSPTATALPTFPPSATVEPTLIPPPAIAPESFGQVQVLHEYWPIIRKAAGLWEKASFGTSATAWAISEDGRYLAAAGCDLGAGTLTLLNSATTISCEATGMGMVAHAFLLILDAKTERIVATLPETGKELTVKQVAFTPDGNKLVYGLDTGQIKIWDIRSAAVESVLGEASPVSPYFGLSDQWVSFSPKAPNGQEQKTEIWDIAGKKLVGELPSSQNGSLSLDGQKRMVYDYPFVVIYDAKTGQKLSDQPMMPDGYRNNYDISPGLSLLAVCNTQLAETPVKIWNPSTGELIKTLQGEWGRCGRLIFSPDGRLLLRFDEHGAGPVIWAVDGWKWVQANPDITPFVKNEDFFVDSLQFSQDGRTVLVDTFNRLTLYGLPAPSSPSAPLATLPGSSPAAPGTALPVPTRPPMSCDLVVQGWLKAHVQPCLPPSRVDAGSFDGVAVSIWMKDSQNSGVIFYIPLSLLRHKLQVGKYIIGDLTDGEDGARIVAGFDYYHPLANRFDSYSSYDGGTIIFSQSGRYISGSFSFGARNDEGRQINVDGVFENIPFSPVNIP